MKPVNQKSLFHFLCDQMDKLDKREISVEEAKAQASIAKQVNNVIKYELDRANTEMKVREFNMKHGSHIEIRNIEGKNFE